jgi:insecticidal toxin complex protein TccC
MNSTPNGKSTQKILDDFGLKATKVERYRDSLFTDFVISVEPAFSNSAQIQQTYELPDENTLSEDASSDTSSETSDAAPPAPRRRNAIYYSPSVFRRPTGALPTQRSSALSSS